MLSLAAKKAAGYAKFAAKRVKIYGDRAVKSVDIANDKAAKMAADVDRINSLDDVSSYSDAFKFIDDFYMMTYLFKH